MITVTLMGGLGNQMFQYATGRALSLRLGTQLEVDLRWFTRPADPANTPRIYGLDKFSVAARPSRRWPARTYAQRLLVRSDRLRGGVVHHEPSSAFDPAVIDLPDRSRLVGYWQCERYFEAVADTIRDELTPTAPLSPYVQALVGGLGPNAVAVHVRRGDYLTNSTMGVCSAGYYRQAGALVAERTGATEFVVFSDDVGWCRANLQLPGTVTFADGGQPDWEDLVAMSRCAHHIIANSSFSWWGAWLARSVDQIVVAPDPWFDDGRPSDIVPERWLRLVRTE